jgi:hypothetical protein
MSFVNLLANDIWSEVDIINRTEAELRAVVSEKEEMILSRKMLGFSLGRMIPTAQEQAELTAFEFASLDAQKSARDARDDMALLQSAMDYEQGITTEASTEVLSLVSLRNTIVTQQQEVI